MARYNEILVGRFARSVQKLFGVKGEVPVGSLAGELGITLSVFNGAENRYLETWDRFFTVAGPTGGAGQSSAVGLRNGKASNVIAVVEQIYVWTPGASLNVSLQHNLTADLPTVVALAGASVPDTRQRPNPSLILSTSTNAASTGASMASIAAPTNTTVLLLNDENQELPITPGEGLQIFNNTVATQINVSILWRERFLEESERA